MELRRQMERGYAMRAQRLAEGLLFASSFVLGDLRPAYVAFAMLLAQAVVSPLASPVALLWTAFARGVPPDRLGNLYYDSGASRGAAAMSSLMLPVVLALRHFGHPTIAHLLVAMPCASCILSATVGFCFGCGWFVGLRDLAARAGLVRRNPEGACDVVLEPEPR